MTVAELRDESAFAAVVERHARLTSLGASVLASARSAMPSTR